MTSSSDAASRSSIEPIVEWWYGCSGGNRYACTFSCHEPYGRLSYEKRFSFLTTSRWLSRFSWLSASGSVAMRSASSQRASSSWFDGSVS